MERRRIDMFTLTGILAAVGTTLAACGGGAPPSTQSPASAKNAGPAGPGARSSEPSAEQQRAADAFAGDWLFHSTITPPGAAPVRADLAMSCTKTASGRANLCTMSGEIPGMGTMEAGILVGLDPLDQKVHFMAMTSDDELHDHVCAWKNDKDLFCTPLQAGLGGQLVTEDLNFSFSGDEGAFKSVIRFADGKQMVFEATGRRGSGQAARTAPSKPPEASPEQKKLVEAFVGSWSLDADLMLPNGARRDAELGLQCKKTAGGKAALCTLGSRELAPGRAYEAAILVGYDPYDKDVHFMMMSSDDELWHRPCTWKGDTTLACGPKRTGVMGMPVTSEVTFDFAGTRGSTRWLTDLGDGKSCSLTAQMSR